MSAVTLPTAARPARWSDLLARLDKPLLLTALTLLALGLIMVASASMPLADHQFNDPFRFFRRQCLYALLGLGLGALVLRLPLDRLQQLGFTLMAISFALLVVVLVPGVGKVVNGSARWLDLVVLRIQVSEPARLGLLIYLAGFLVRRQVEVRDTFFGVGKVMALLAAAGLLLLVEPDLGAAVVLTLAVMVMLWVAGAPILPFILLLGAGVGSLYLLITLSPYRLARLTGFMDPWADPYNTGFQLTQSLMAIGSGHWFGLGLGSSVQKMFYLPEAHTDFLFAILAEELGLVGSLAVIALYSLLFWRSLRIANAAAQRGHWYGAYLTIGLGVWLASQAFINLGVNMGLLPTKGLTLPLMSYGGSSLLVVCLIIALILRVSLENNEPPLQTKNREARS
ncbi:MAG: putative lipid II flippase FtsW [Pseudomonadota bacterium]